MPETFDPNKIKSTDFPGLEHYYEKWIVDCEESAIYCEAKGQDARARGYKARKEIYEKILKEIRENA